MNRVLDIGLACVGLAVAAPVLLGMALAVKLDSPGPALFRQTRIGRNRKSFQLVKLRTMTSGDSGPSVTAQHDPRITRVGRLLRRTKLDELPQLWNVLRGDMSIVGPRPEVPVYVAKYRDEWDALFDVRPGLTDTASLTFRDEEMILGAAHDRERAYTEVVMPMKLALALQDVQQRSLLNDLRVLARTAATVLLPAKAGEDQVIRDATRRIRELNEQEHP